MHVHPLFPGLVPVYPLKEIENELRDVTEWYQLGVQLELSLDTLRTIECNHPHDAQHWKIKVLSCWVWNAPETSRVCALRLQHCLHRHLQRLRTHRDKLQFAANLFTSFLIGNPHDCLIYMQVSVAMNKMLTNQSLYWTDPKEPPQ